MLWNKYKQKEDNLKDYYGQNIETKFLWHGSGQNDPKIIYADEIGFDIKFSRDGLHGRGLYFHERLGYCDERYVSKQGNLKQVLLAEVIIGQCEISQQQDLQKTPSNLPPGKLPQTKTGVNKKYDSITDGDQMYIVYETGLAYPHWLITYT